MTLFFYLSSLDRWTRFLDSFSGGGARGAVRFFGVRALVEGKFDADAKEEKGATGQIL